MARATAREHSIGKETFHYKWDNSLPPAVEIESGDVVHFETEEVTAGQLKNGDPASRLGELDFDRLYPLGGPVYVKGAEPGDALEVEILELKPGSWGWSAILPGLGLLASDFPEPYVRYFDLGDRGSAELRHDIHIPIAPFCGTMGVANDEPGRHDVLPPTQGAGNIDTRPGRTFTPREGGRGRRGRKRGENRELNSPGPGRWRLDGCRLSARGHTTVGPRPPTRDRMLATPRDRTPTRHRLVPSACQLGQATSVARGHRPSRPSR